MVFSFLEFMVIPMLAYIEVENINYIYANDMELA